MHERHRHKKYHWFRLALRELCRLPNLIIFTLCIVAGVLIVFALGHRQNPQKPAIPDLTDIEQKFIRQ